MSALAIDYVGQDTHCEFHLPLSVFKKPQTQAEYDKLQNTLDRLIDEVRDHAKHPLAIAMQIIGENLEQFDDQYHPPIGKNISHREMVRHLMDSQHLRQKDLAPIFGGQANVSKFLRGERPLTKNQIAGLKKQFGMSADFFV
jgi:HTH-type transcriptional regulator/antitoxin HigA